jgi:REP-associated tyrosine transposase
MRLIKVAASNQGGKKTKHSHSVVQLADKELVDSSADVLFEQVQSSPYNLSYTCFLIPRIPSQQLIGELAENLPQWLKVVCVSFEWKLEFVTVSPEYFQWAVSVLPVIPTGRIIEHVRYKTSEMIFANFKQLKKENVPADFWATGYLILSGVQPNPKEIVERYLKIMHQQHGY